MDELQEHREKPEINSTVPSGEIQSDTSTNKGVKALDAIIAKYLITILRKPGPSKERIQNNTIHASQAQEEKLKLRYK